MVRRAVVVRERVRVLCQDEGHLDVGRDAEHRGERGGVDQRRALFGAGLEPASAARSLDHHRLHTPRSRSHRDHAREGRLGHEFGRRPLDAHHPSAHGTERCRQALTPVGAARVEEPATNEPPLDGEGERLEQRGRSGFECGLRHLERDGGPNGCACGRIGIRHGARRIHGKNVGKVHGGAARRSDVRRNVGTLADSTMRKSADNQFEKIELLLPSDSWSS
jgi:hypothetical protein